MDSNSLPIKSSQQPINSHSLDDQLQYNNWLFDNIRPYIRGRVLEIDSGSGLMSALFMENAIPIHLSDPDKTNQENLKIKFHGNPYLKMVHLLDLNSPDFEMLHSNKFSLIDTVIATNILDHGPYDQEAMRNAKKLLPARGRIAMMLPIHTAVYDQESLDPGMLLKYNQKYIKSLLSTDSEIIKLIHRSLALLILARKI